MCNLYLNYTSYYSDNLNIMVIIFCNTNLNRNILAKLEAIRFNYRDQKQKLSELYSVAKQEKNMAFHEDEK